MNKTWLTAALFVISAACSPADAPEPVTQDSGEPDAEADLSEPKADKYAFCDWRTLEPTGDLAADLIGEWVLLVYGIDYGSHRVLTLNADGTYRELQFATGGCEEERVCFGAGPPDLCGATEVSGTWSVEQQVVWLSGQEFGWDLRDGFPRENAFAFSYPDGSRRLTAATCDDCL